MFRSFLGLFLVSLLAPALASAASVNAPCNLVDQETLDAFNLDAHTMKVERKDVPGKDSAPPVTAYVCTYVPRASQSPILSVTTVEIPPGARTLKPSCTEIPGGGLTFSICTAAVRNSFATFSLSMKSSTSTSMNKSFPAHIERSIKKLAEPSSDGASVK